MKKQQAVYLEEEFIEKYKKMANDYGLKLSEMYRNDIEAMYNSRAGLKFELKADKQA